MTEDEKEILSNIECEVFMKIISVAKDISESLVKKNDISIIGSGLVAGTVSALAFMIEDTIELKEHKLELIEDIHKLLFSEFNKEEEAE